MLRLFTVLALAACLPQPAFAARLEMPYARPAQIAAPVQEKKFECRPSPVKAPKNLEMTAVYGKNDPERDDANSENKKQYAEETKGLMEYENKLLAMTNAYYAAQPDGAAKARCALEWMQEWAEQSALLGSANKVGISVRHWALASLASAYGQIRDEPSLDTEQTVAVRTWIREIAYNVVSDYDDPKNKRENNLAYWAAWAVTIAGIALDDQTLFEWGLKGGTKGIQEINEDGTLPLEMDRGSKAMLYHQFALAPLLMIAEAGAANGFNLYDMNDGRLHRLAKRVLVGLQSPLFFESRTGYAQDGAETLSAGHMAWLEVYNARFPNYRMKQMIAEKRPMISRRLGGNMTLLLGGNSRN